MSDTPSLENDILRDIHERAGLSFRKLAGIDTRDRSVADAVLPVLAGWVERLQDVPHRRGVYSRFHTPHAYQYIDNIIAWWTTEQDPLAAGSLTQTISLLLKCDDAERVWTLCQKLPQRQFHFMLLSKLALCPDVEHEVRDALLKALQITTLRAGDLAYIAEVRDPRIQRWFTGQINNPDPSIRTVAKRVASRGTSLPRGVEYAESVPNRNRELFSTEADLGEFSRVLKAIAGQFKLRIAKSVENGAFLSTPEIGRWLLAKTSQGRGRYVGLWLRLQDADTVEVVLVDSVARGGLAH